MNQRGHTRDMQCNAIINPMHSIQTDLRGQAGGMQW